MAGALAHQYFAVLDDHRSHDSLHAHANILEASLVM
jgi:hypothetical protein